MLTILSQFKSLYEIKTIFQQTTEKQTNKKAEYVHFVSFDSVQGLEFKTQITVIFDYADKTRGKRKTV